MTAPSRWWMEAVRRPVPFWAMWLMFVLVLIELWRVNCYQAEVAELVLQIKAELAQLHCEPKP